MSKLIPYFLFNGNCMEAMEFYKKIFKAETYIETFGDGHVKISIPENFKDKISHGELRFNGETLMFADVLPTFDYNSGNNVVTAYKSSSLDEIKEIFSSLKINGTVTMELQETPWSKCYGSVTDQFGISWNLNFIG